MRRLASIYIELIAFCNLLDQAGLYSEADLLDGMIRSAAEGHTKESAEDRIEVLTEKFRSYLENPEKTGAFLMKEELDEAKRLIVKVRELGVDLNKAKSLIDVGNKYKKLVDVKEKMEKWMSGLLSTWKDPKVFLSDELEKIMNKKQKEAEALDHPYSQKVVDFIDGTRKKRREMSAVVTRLSNILSKAKMADKVTDEMIETAKDYKEKVEQQFGTDYKKLNNMAQNVYMLLMQMKNVPIRARIPASVYDLMEGIP